MGGQTRIGVVGVGFVGVEVLKIAQRNLCEVFRGAECEVIEDVVSIPTGAYNPVRRQYNSSSILMEISACRKKLGVDCVLGVTDVDLYVPGLNYVFGEASSVKKAALISLFRLKQEFYGISPDMELLHERLVKEAVHEVGHMMGLEHCKNSSCVMFFSNSIVDTDKKSGVFCEKCRLHFQD